MGMDVMGKSPVSETGEYFRNNVWAWQPLWAFCTAQHPELVGPDPGSGHMNDGYGLDAEAAIELGEALMRDVNDGTAQQYRISFYEEIARLPRVPCTHCNATGTRTDTVGISMGMHDKQLDPEVAMLVGREFGWCNGCDGVGTCEDLRASYWFDESNVQAFAEFLISSGGFEIW